MESELTHDVGAMHLDSSRAVVQVSGDLLGGLADGHFPENLSLAGRQFPDRWKMLRSRLHFARTLEDIEGNEGLVSAQSVQRKPKFLRVGVKDQCECPLFKGDSCHRRVQNRATHVVRGAF